MNFQAPNIKPPRIARSFLLGVWLFSGAWILVLGGSATTLEVEIAPLFNGAPLVFDSLTNVTAAGQKISVTRLDFLVSNIALRRADGTWLERTNWFAFINAREGRTSFALENIPLANYDRVRFHIGLEPAINHRDSAQWPAGHPLNPEVNGLHWGWAGGYVFLALEGGWLANNGRPSGYSYHLANDPQLMTIELPAGLNLSADGRLPLALNVDKIFSAIGKIELSDATDSTHSRTNDPLAVELRQNIERAFKVGRTGFPFGAPPSSDPNRSKPGLQTVIIATNATPYRLTISQFFPRPDLPRDNPLTGEGVVLGSKLFFDRRLSADNSQSCASCHHPRSAFSENRRFSRGVEGEIGTRNAMPLFNLAWKNSFFWDGRAATLREQVLQPIQNPIEMHETLTNLVAKLETLSLAPGFSPVTAPAANSTAAAVFAIASTAETVSGYGISNTWLKPGADESGGTSGARGVTRPAGDYAALFTRAFGSPEISADRIARALEQFLLVQVSFDSKFDRVLLDREKFTEEEQRGFELFNTEYDPRHEQYGADCFHCHGGPLFQSQTFANNGLDSEFRDLGRYNVTKRDGDQGKFSVPSLRNVAVTAPYMHDGRFRTLEDVVEHYCTGTKRSATLDPNLAKHPDGGVPLSAADKRALVAFLKTLADERFLPRPATETLRGR
jgi:cytochrome c peroxidase